MRAERSVLHIDDDPQFVRLVGQYLGRHGFQVQALHDPREYVHHIAEYSQRVILLDVNMPHVDGLEVLQAIKHLDGSMQVIVLTAMTSMSTLMQAFCAGAECLFKPIRQMDTLLDAVSSSFRKIDRWWQALEELSAQRKHAALDERNGLELPSAMAPFFPAAGEMTGVEHGHA